MYLIIYRSKQNDMKIQPENNSNKYLSSENSMMNSGIDEDLGEPPQLVVKRCHDNYHNWQKGGDRLLVDNKG